MKATEIFIAWQKASKPNENDFRIAEERLSVCYGCPNLKKLAGVEYCGICLCPVKKKIFSDKNSCPEDKW